MQFFGRPSICHLLCGGCKMEMVFHYNKSTANVQNIAQELIVVLVACLASSYRCILDTALDGAEWWPTAAVACCPARRVCTYSDADCTLDCMTGYSASQLTTSALHGCSDPCSWLRSPAQLTSLSLLSSCPLPPSNVYKWVTIPIGSTCSADWWCRFLFVPSARCIWSWQMRISICNKKPYTHLHYSSRPSGNNTVDSWAGACLDAN